ncbi:MAG: heavy metal translocating P-type ATPase [Gammaproteobacteria bacterium]|nr:heavy metal translocating P-type ATPase [Gammaproteobacteria bacterium]
MKNAEHCYHCGLPYTPATGVSGTIDGVKREFCCFGCHTVCRTIHEAGLQGFYQRTPEDIQLSPPPPIANDVALYDLDEIQAEYVDTLDDIRQIELLVEGIHCAACVWLIERSLASVDGIIESRVNLAARRLRVRWDNRELHLSVILSRLAQIGYLAVPFEVERARDSAKAQLRSLLFRMAFAGFAMMNLLWVSIALYSGADEGEFRNMFHWIGFALATPTLLYSGYPFLRGAWTGVRNLHLGMDVPIAIGALVTYFYSLYVTVSDAAYGEVYYDTVVNFLFVILVGRYLEAISKRKAVDSTQRLLDLQPRGATVLRDGEESIVPIRGVRVDDHVLVRPGERIAVDACIVDGRASIDESMLSGESTPVLKNIGDKVSAGTLLLDGFLRLRVEATLKQTVLGNIIRLVEDAQSSKAPIQQTADRIVPWFVLTTLMLASVTFAWWYGSGFELALMAATAVLIITCPCAFGLATPMAIAVAAGTGAREGILLRNSGVMESLTRVTHVVFDKTGTLTEGRMCMQQIVPTGEMDAETILGIAASVERYSEHSVARAIVDSAKERELSFTKEIQEFSNTPGCGVSAKVDGRRILVGTQQWLSENGVDAESGMQARIRDWAARGVGCVFVASDSQLVGIIALSDRLREDASELVTRLRQLGLGVTLLTGDRLAVAQRFAEQLGGIDVIAEVMPQDKEEVIRAMQQRGECVAMVGDGINDAPALSRADIGIALGSGTDVSAECADIILIRNELLKVLQAFQLSTRTLRTIRQNILISFAYNIVMIPLAMMSFITPLIAAISMPVSSLLVIGNAARIRQMFNTKLVSSGKYQRQESSSSVVSQTEVV